VHGHARPERRHFLREPVAGLRLQARRPLSEHLARRVEQARGLGVAERPRQLDGRQARGVQNLVGIGVSDSAEHPRIGQHALQRVIAGAQRGRERVDRQREHVRSPGVHPVDCGPAADDVQRRLLPRSGLRKQQRALRKIERCESELRGNRRAAFAPSQPARNHEVDHDEEVAVELKDDPLSDPGERPDGVPFDGADRGLVAADEERAGQTRALDDTPQDPRPERREV